MVDSDCPDGRCPDCLGVECSKNALADYDDGDGHRDWLDAAFSCQGTQIANLRAELACMTAERDEALNRDHMGLLTEQAEGFTWGDLIAKQFAPDVPMDGQRLFIDVVHLQQKVRDLTAERDRLAAKVAGDDWVPVEEQLPEGGLHVIACAGRSRFAAYYSEEDQFWIDVTGMDDVRVTHWRKFPAPPKEADRG